MEVFTSNTHWAYRCYSYRAFVVYFKPSHLFVYIRLTRTLSVHKKATPSAAAQPYRRVHVYHK